jgi:hypothetical protein
MKHFTFFLLCVLAVASVPAYAAKMHVTWTPPTQNTDGTPLTDLTGYRIEWGSCNADGSFGTYQAGINVISTATAAWIYPTGLNPVCVRAFSINSANLLSPAVFASGTPKPTISKPTQLN